LALRADVLSRSPFAGKARTVIDEQACEGCGDCLDRCRFGALFLLCRYRHSKNNAAEREIRMAKLRQKVSGSMRTLTGAKHFAILHSYLSITAKHGIDVLDALIQLTTGKPWVPQTT
jgi:ferredoxin